MTFPYRLVATDLDGTLLRSDGTVSARTREAIAATSAAGAAHIVVTGRNVPWTQSILASLDYTGIAVCGQGGQVYHAGERRLLTSVTLDRRLAAAALAEIERVTGPLAIGASRYLSCGSQPSDRHKSMATETRGTASGCFGP